MIPFSERRIRWPFFLRVASRFSRARRKCLFPNIYCLDRSAGIPATPRAMVRRNEEKLGGYYVADVGCGACRVDFCRAGLCRDVPAELKIGTLYASSGRYASISMPVFSALKLWADLKNAEGGVYVKAFDKKIPVKLVAYDNQSNTATASTLYNQLVTQDKVDLLVADSGSVLTAPAGAVARDHKMFVFDQTGTGASFFSKDNPYIALMADPVSTVWPKPVADFVTHDGPGLGIKKVAILYATNEFTGTQANAFRKFVKDSGAPIEIVYDQGVPTETTNYTTIINNINNTNPDAVIHFGYAPNDIAFLRNVQDLGIKFKMLFTIYSGLETELLEKNVGAKGLEHIWTYVPPSELDYPVNFGMKMKDFRE